MYKSCVERVESAVRRYAYIFRRPYPFEEKYVERSRGCEYAQGDRDVRSIRRNDQIRFKKKIDLSIENLLYKTLNVCCEIFAIGRERLNATKLINLTGEFMIYSSGFSRDRAR